MLYGKAAHLALNIEFIAKPEDVHRVHDAIPAAVHDALQHITGFAGSLVLISDRERRLVSVITFWDDAERITQCSRRTRWVQRVLAPYTDHCLRVRTLDAYAPAMRFAGGEGRVRTGSQFGEGGDLAATEAALCIATS